MIEILNKKTTTNRHLAHFVTTLQKIKKRSSHREHGSNDFLEQIFNLNQHKNKSNRHVKVTVFSEL